jgi:hypothetical protein
MLEFILSSVGLTFIIVLSYLFKKLRDGVIKKSPFFGKLISCTMCTGFHVGILIKFLLMYYENHIFIYKDIIILIIYGLISSIISYIIYLLIKPYIDKYD